ncbi:glycosyltransferase family 4 protein [Alphaproteobacteria bacterium]|nr:glycosyltransferase family 4 protein [Alphaproteobacteria bacterium]
MKIKIALVSNNFWTKYRFRSEQIRYLLGKEISVDVLAGDDQWKDRLTNLGAKTVVSPSITRHVFSFRIVCLIWFYLRQFNANSYSLIFLFTFFPNIFGGIVCRLLNQKYICVITGLGNPFLSGYFKRFLAIFLYRVAVGNAQCIFFLNENDREYFIEHKIIDNQRTKIINVGIDIKYYMDFPVKPYCKTKQTFVFLFIGRLIREKGVLDFIAAAATLKKRSTKFRFQILGDFYENNLSAISKQTLEKAVSKGFVDYLGFHDDIRPFVSASDCVVLPSYREAKGLTLAEAALMGKVLIASDVPGCNDTCLDGVNGLLFKAGCHQDLVEKMLNIGNLSEKKLNAMGRQGRLIMSKKFNQQRVNETYCHEISRLEFQP